MADTPADMHDHVPATERSDAFVTDIGWRGLGARREASTAFDAPTRDALLARLDGFDRVRAKGAADVRNLY